MAGRAILGLAARTGLTATPEVQLALELLRLPALELRARVERELAANPLLETEDGEREPGLEVPVPGPGDAVDTGDPGGDSVGEGEGAEATAGLRGTEPSLVPRGVREVFLGETPDWAAETTLGEHLAAQFRLETGDPAVLAAGEHLVGSLDERGYLPDEAERGWREACAESGLPPAALDAAREILRGLDPAGVGARDLRDCLLLQLRARRREESLAWRIVRDRFADLAAGCPERAGRALGATPTEARRALAEIRRLRPHPGRLVGGGPVRYIYPDLTVLRIDGQWHVQVDDRAVPRVRCASWGGAWAAAEADAGARAAVRERVTAARRLVRALERRRGTLVRVMECILEEQGEFFERGTPHLRPLNLRTVAGRLGLHESTVARVVRSKHAQTPRGLLPLRFFFSGGLCTEHGPDASSRAVRARVGAFVSGEDQARPLTDAEIARLLAREGIRIARRTVAKYRMSMRIERAARRRSPAGPRVRRRAGGLVRDPRSGTRS